MTRQEQINKAVLLSMIPHIVKANAAGLDRETVQKLIVLEQQQRALARAHYIREPKPRLKLVSQPKT